MLLPMDPGQGAGYGWSTQWTGTGAKRLLDVIAGNAAAWTSLTIAACTAAPLFDASSEVTTEALDVVELTDALVVLNPALGYERGTLDLTPQVAAYSWFPSRSVSGSDVTFGALGNTGTVAWDPVTHLCLLNAGVVLAVVELVTPAVCTAGKVLRIPSGSFSFLATTGEAVA